MHSDYDKRMKAYEAVTAAALPRRTYTILRLDGRSFHSWTKGLDRPFDRDLQTVMARCAATLCKEISGAQFAYTQSDEISILLTDFGSTHTEPWFGGKIQKIVSVSASILTAEFNQFKNLFDNLKDRPVALFDSRVFIIPDPTEVMNYFRWRQQDAVRNSISMLAQSQFSHKELQNKSSNDMQEMLWSKKNINWNDVEPGFKRGLTISPISVFKTAYWTRKDGTDEFAEHESTEWVTAEPDFFKDDWLQKNIPQYG